MLTRETTASFVPERSSWQQAATLLGCFLGSIGVGTLVGAWLQPEGKATAAVLIFALLLEFIGGLALWGTISASIMATALFGGDLARAFLRFFLRGRRREDLPHIETNRDKIREAAFRVLGWTRVFVWLAGAIALIAAPLAGWFATRGFVVASAVTAVIVVGYGAVLRALARSGYLVPPDIE